MPVHISATKLQFMHALGLNPDVQAHREVFITMWVSNQSKNPILGLTDQEKDETTVAHVRLVSNRHNLRPELVNHPTVEPPYTYGQMNPAAIITAIEQIWANGSQTTQPYYNFGDSRMTEVYNWVIRWLVYKRFRYTDRRNQKRTTDNFDDDDDDDDDGNDDGLKNGMVCSSSIQHGF